MALRGVKRRRRRILHRMVKTDALAAIYTAVLEVIRAAKESDPSYYEESAPKDRYPLRDQMRIALDLPPFNYNRDFVHYNDVRKQIHSAIDRDLAV